MDAPPTQYARTEDGVHIGYWSAGDGAPLLHLPALGDMSSETLFGVPSLARSVAVLTPHFRVYGLDFRNHGRSDHGIAALEANDFQRGIDAVVSAVGLRRYELLAYAYAAPLAIQHASQHPDRIEHLTLIAPIIRGVDGVTDLRGVIEHVATVDGAVAAHAAERALGFDGADADAFAELFRSARQNPDRAALVRARTALDASGLVPSLMTPTLVVHIPSATRYIGDRARELAAALPNGRFLEAPDFDPPILHMPGAHAVTTTSGSDAQRGAAPTLRAEALRTILFTDVENSTDLVVRQGDAKYRALLADHERLVREALAAHGGNEIKTIGDSFMCWFSSASAALDAAIAMQRAIAGHYGDSLRIRIGVHAGEPIQEADGDLYGTSVVRASRIMGQADGGQILVSQVVTDLVEGKGYLFSDAGEFALKGYERPARLFDVAWEEAE